MQSVRERAALGPGDGNLAQLGVLGVHFKFVMPHWVPELKSKHQLKLLGE